MFNSLSESLEFLLNKPGRIFIYGILVTFFILAVDGSFWRFWSLYQNQREIKEQILDLSEKSRQLDFEIRQAKSLSSIERQAVEQFDYIREDDLVFIFSE